ncbi:MAG: lytic transglycosylase domain-containing protein [Hyphomicrobiales bacterium]|nr:lytic transglycosylase domain-containing protein [Hyphomicrobiales bacterium]MCP5371793.1 lytic transglycosylase domain-containing protein [Hyphomicrobiales bacterium]
MSGNRATARLVAWLAVGLAVLALAGPAAARDDTSRGAALGPRQAGGVDLPRVLSDTDADLYRQVFALQEKGNWKAADRRIAKLDDRLLMGHVLAQRYLHPTAYRSRYKELKAWMDEYADHPDAATIHKLAMRRKPRDWRAPKRPVPAQGGGPALVLPAAKKPAKPPRKSLSRAQRKDVAWVERRIRRYLLAGATLSVRRTLEEREVRRLMPTVDYDRQRAKLAAAYLGDGEVELALDWALAAAKRSGRWLPQAHWIAGLAAWQLGRPAEAAAHFEDAAARARDPWTEAAAAFWAARAHLVDRRPERFNALMARAAAHPRTFYGLLAGRVLGLPSPFRWDLPPAAERELAQITTAPAGRRALALAQVGETGRAGDELRALAAGAGPDRARAVLALAGSAGLPSLALRMDRRLFPHGGGMDGAAYPAPAWKPAGGFRIDRALVYAVIRQESKFNPRARSWAGASGLMQLMPATAAYIAGDRRYRRGGKGDLLKPEVNMALGQKYIAYLMRDPAVQGDLLLFATAWNGGPGNMAKWWRATRHGGDALTFIESIPSRETRDFIEKVLANFWIYRDRLGQPSPSLDAIAAGGRPVYTALDKSTLQVAEDVQD